MEARKTGSNHIKLSDGSLWPRPCMESDDRPTSWAARYSTLTREEIMRLASIADSYGYLVCETDRAKRDLVAREIRAALKAEASNV